MELTTLVFYLFEFCRHCFSFQEGSSFRCSYSRFDPKPSAGHLRLLPVHPNVLAISSVSLFPVLPPTVSALPPLCSSVAGVLCDLGCYPRRRLCGSGPQICWLYFDVCFWFSLFWMTFKIWRGRTVFILKLQVQFILESCLWLCVELIGEWPSMWGPLGPGTSLTTSSGPLGGQLPLPFLPGWPSPL